ncbi:6794_t:CDS:2 [Acaulospora colombiana]|uniref:6794_t:CDS:1 n=1 Tax=Acaulospora colombiana TaxID=27376 RepID=A0ACA9MRP3_9GLOM|nr:6794_t:CDS:2 [Acaulospora colombiana]
MPVKVLEEKVVLEHPSGSSAEVYFYGATVTSWKYQEKERLFLSEDTHLDGTSAIHGGIPLVFPQFGKASNPSAETAELPQHGFARVSRWEWQGISVDSDSQVSVRFRLTDAQVPEALRQKWPKKFRLICTVTLAAETLTSTIEVKNEDTKSFDFNTLFHTYYLVPDISKVSIKGLSNVTYFDKVANGPETLDTDDSITIDREVDRIYIGVPNDDVYIDLGYGTSGNFILKTINLKDKVVWNPWIDKSRRMSGFGDEEYKKMVCVEPGTVSSYITLNVGETWDGGQTLSIIP